MRIVNKKIIAIFTGNRAEYGLQYSIIDAIRKHKKLSYKLIVSGAHLEKKFGYTIKQIKKDGFKISSLIKLKNRKLKTKAYTPLIISDAIQKITLALNKIKPDIMLVNADRFETFAATIASSQMYIPTFHIEGGDITFGGTLDDNVRHAITKLSNIHFVTNKQSKENLINLGEENWRIFNFGLPSNDLINKKKLAETYELENYFNFKFTKYTILFTYHPVFGGLKQIKKECKILTRVLNKLLTNKDYSIIATYPNNDYGSGIIIENLISLSKKHNKNFRLIKSLGNYYFHSILNLSSKKKIVLMGNSSSGIKESVAFKCPTINIGSRQNGRLKPNNVLNTQCNYKEIMSKINYALYNELFLETCKKCKNPYYVKDSGKKIANLISKTKINKKLIIKRQNFLKYGV